MKATQTGKDQVISVRVNGWQNARRVRVLQDQVGLQVTVPSCNHCVTCQRRVREISETLASQPTVIHQWRYPGDGAQWLFLPRVKGCEPLDLLRQTLGIWIDEI